MTTTTTSTTTSTTTRMSARLFRDLAYFALGVIACLNWFRISNIVFKDQYFKAVKGVDQASEPKLPSKYVPASTERYFMSNMKALGYNSIDNPNTCDIWSDPEVTSQQIHAKLVAYDKELDDHTKAVDKFKPIPDLLRLIQKNDGNHEVCEKARIHPDGIKALFPSGQLSFTPTSGYIDPLLPPMRDRKICTLGFDEVALSLNYLVHDFEFMCRKLKPTSRRVLIDMGASLQFHGEDQPMLKLIQLYEKFGFHFDHIYAFEFRFEEPQNVYGELLPEKYMPSYHWINVGVTSEEGHKLNPLHSILKTFDEDDFIVLKIDIDTSSIEVPLAKQLLKDKDGVFGKLVDQFYFEHHVHLGELAPAWIGTMEGSIKDSFDLFHGLRQKGIPAHFWP